MEGIALFALGAIILLDIATVVFVLKVGSTHDHHHDVSSVGSSQAIAQIYSTYNFSGHTLPTPQPEPGAAGGAVLLEAEGGDPNADIKVGPDFDAGEPMGVHADTGAEDDPGNDEAADALDNM
ncbi:MAG TPA: hypothetical protein VHL11_12710 [Phototrophicaceae bacterium]|jgi:hypothetical protein|nr:hypothetical protein [Phototrophicaceae bacterium]